VIVVADESSPNMFCLTYVLITACVAGQVPSPQVLIAPRTHAHRDASRAACDVQEYAQVARPKPMIPKSSVNSFSTSILLIATAAN
jgi:hypothetical protein